MPPGTTAFVSSTPAGRSNTTGLVRLALDCGVNARLCAKPLEMATALVKLTGTLH